MQINVEAEIVGMKKDIEYLKTEHREFKEFMKRFEAVPYQIESINEKMDTVLEDKRNTNSKIDALFKQLVNKEPEEHSQTKKFFDWGADWIKYVAIALLGLIVILGSVLGVTIPFVGGG